MPVPTFQFDSGGFAIIGYYGEMTAPDNGFESLGTLGEDVLAEVVREGELLLSSQLQAGIAADQRALTFAGFATTAAGAVFGLVIANPMPKDVLPPTLVAVLGLTLATALLVAVVMAILSALPRQFFFPGNEPVNWAPEYWSLPASAPRTLKAARVEQAQVLQAMITANKAGAERQAKLIRHAVWLAFGAAIAALAAAMAAYVVLAVAA